MAKLDIIIAPDPRLKQKAKPVAAVDASIRQQFENRCVDTPGDVGRPATWSALTGWLLGLFRFGQC